MNIEKLIKMSRGDLLVLQEKLIDTKQPEDFNDDEKSLMKNITLLLNTNNPCICSLCNNICDEYIININKDNKNICDRCVCFDDELFEEIEKYSENLQKQFDEETDEDNEEEVCELCNEQNTIKGYCNNGQCNKTVCEECDGYNNRYDDFFCSKQCSGELHCECGNPTHKNNICGHGIADGICCICKECRKEMNEDNEEESDEDSYDFNGIKRKFHNNIKSPERYPPHSPVY